MSKEGKISHLTVPELMAFKAKGEKITALTAYDALMAALLDECGIDLILVGDSLGMVVAGKPNTLSVSLEQMIYHSQIVSAAVKRAVVIADMPFLTYQVSRQQAIQNAGRLIKETDVQGVKLEGGREIADTVRRLVEIGIPVMGHLGLVPQSIHKFGSYKLQGNDPETAKRLKEDALILQEAGVFSIVLEKIPAALAKEITESLEIPTIGIGAGPACDGQILVSQDMLGLFDKFKPRFVRRYAELAKDIRNAFAQYREDVKQARFPSDDESF